MSRYKKLALSILLDAIGYVSFIIPGVGEFSDVIWAPLSAWIMIKLYKGNPGKVAGVVSFVEEALPGVDVIPTFTIMWFYTEFFTKKKKTKSLSN
ncbi:hypothetical protein [Gaetbulibacter aestuarii]|uniref:DUF1232 domain-containing protein n=1 Tax=Gaetbulibacter aestuarii TaxID=1502358 RepID=A0ABW7N4X7_9FLAO